MNRIGFYNQRFQWGQLSNYHRLHEPIIYNNQLYATSEHFYQAQKFMGPNATRAERAWAEHIRTARTPGVAKALASLEIAGGTKWRELLNGQIQVAIDSGIRQRDDWESVKNRAMFDALKLKFAADSVSRNILLSTGNARLCEDSPYDLYWGTGGVGGAGRNILGRMLMQIRERLVAHLNRPSAAATRVSTAKRKRNDDDDE